MKFSIQPPPGESAFDQWRDAMKAVCRLPTGMPPEFRKKVWLSLADHYLFQLKINWEQTIRFTFNERSNPDDEQLGMQIVKDLHRTGCSNFSGDDNDEDRAVLKRLLLAYARWNKRVGYCQGFNVIAALLLNVMDRKEDDALKVMIYLIDSVLPESYFSNNLRALSVDMAVFRDLLKLTYPKLAKHLDRLQLAAQDIRTGACYEPPLPNVFTMQWFLTLFATCLPVNIVLRVWDSILLDGSEILLRSALTIWGKLAKKIMSASSADEFYSLMGELSSCVMQGSVFDGDAIIKSIYSMGDFPLPHLNELREKYTYNIRPISQPSGNSQKNGKRSVFKSILNSDEDDLDDDDIAAMACLPGSVGSSDISVLGPGVYGSEMEEGTSKTAPEMERMTTDIQSLKLQYERLKQRQRQAHIIIAAASAKKVKPSAAHEVKVSSAPAVALVPSIESPVAMNHLFLGKASSNTRNRLVTDGPRICAPSQPSGNSAVLTKQLQAVANAHAVSRSKRMKTSNLGRGGAGVSQRTAPHEIAALPPVKTVPSASSVMKTSLISDPGESDLASRLPTNILASGHSANNDSATLHKQSSVDEPGALDTLPVDLPLAERASEISLLPEVTARASEISLLPEVTAKKEAQCLQLCETVISTTSETFTRNTDNCHIDTNEKCEDIELKGNCENENQEYEKHTLGCLTMHSTLCSIENLSCQSLSADKLDALPNETYTPLAKSALEDSGFVSPSAVSPMMMLNRKLHNQDADMKKDGNVIYHDEDVILSVTERSTEFLDLSTETSQHELDPSNVQLVISQPQLAHTQHEADTEQNTQPQLAHTQHEADTEKNTQPQLAHTQHEADTEQNTQPQLAHTHHEADTEQNTQPKLAHTQHEADTEQNIEAVTRCESSPDGCGDDLFLERETSSTAERDQTKAIESSRKSSIGHSEAIAIPASHPEVLTISSSVIETVPVPATVDVIKKSGDDESNNIICSVQKARKVSTSVIDETDHAKGVIMRSISDIDRKEGEHSVMISYKPSGKHKRARRFSSPAGHDLTKVCPHHLSQSALAKTNSKPFNPFPVRHFNANRAKTGLKLGLYSESTLEKLRGLQPKTSSS